MSHPIRHFPLLPEVVEGETADVYFLRTRDALQAMGIDPTVTMVFFSGRHGGCLAGLDQVVQLLSDAGFDGELQATGNGERFEPGDTVLTLRGRYSQFGIFETAMLGILSSTTAWRTAAAECVAAAGDVPVVSFGARHIHPNVAAIMDAAAVEAGCVSCSTPLGARLAGVTVSGTMPHAFILILGDTLKAAEVFDQTAAPDVPRIVLVDTFTDEAIESVRVARGMQGRLAGVRLDTPSELGGVTPALVQNVRFQLDQAGFPAVTIFVSGGMTPDRITEFRKSGAPVDGFGVGSFIASARPIEFTADIREIEGRPVHKRGRTPGVGDVSGLQPLKL